VQLRSRFLPVAAAVAAAAGLAACGGGAGVGAGGGSPQGAALLAAATPVFVSVDTDFGSEQWQAVEALVQRFPSGQEALDSLLQQVGEQGLEFETDVKPALGPELDVALLDVQADEPTVVMLTQPTDPAKLEALLAQGDEPPVWRVEDGWYVVADSEEAIDRALAGDDGSLAESDVFEQAMADLPSDAVARVYVDGAALIQAVEQGAGQGTLGDSAPGLGSLSGLTGSFDSLSLAFVAEPEGVRVEGVVATPDAPQLEAGSADLGSLVPSDVLLFASFNGLDKGLSQLLDAVGQQTPDFDQSLAQIELGLGISLEDDLLPIFAGEGALYVRAGAPIPEVTLLLSPDDPTRALATLDKLTAAIGAFGALGGGDGAPELGATDTTIAGVPAKQLQINEQLSLYYAVVDDHVVLTTAVKGIADLVAGGARLVDDPLFQEAKEAAGVPDETSGFFYVNLEGAISALETVEAFQVDDQETLANLQVLRYLVVHASADERGTRFAGFLGIG
jgi:hypothetical protein